MAVVLIKEGVILRFGIDLDGVISPVLFYNPSVRLPWWLYILLLPLSFSMIPNPRTVKELRDLKKTGNEIIIISARPKQFSELTKAWLELHRVPFDYLFCVGFGKGTKKRKLEIIKKENIELFIDDDKRIVKFLEKNSIDVRRFG